MSGEEDRVATTSQPGVDVPVAILRGIKTECLQTLFELGSDRVLVPTGRIDCDKLEERGNDTVAFDHD